MARKKTATNRRKAQAGENGGATAPPLAPCICGNQPTALIVEAQQASKYGHVMANCCGTWGLEFATNFSSDNAEIMKKATDAWNAAPRA